MDAAMIARELGGEQQRALLGAWQLSGPSLGAFVRVDSHDLFESLEDADLIRGTGMLTPLGLEVRAILQAHQGASAADAPE